MNSVGSIKLKYGRWVIKTTPDVILRLKRIFPSTNQSVVGEVSIRATPENAHEILWVMERFRFDPEEARFLKILKKEAKGYRDMITRMQSVNDTPIMTTGLRMAIPARPYQTVAAKLGLDQKFLLVGDQFGVGKTVTAITMFTDPRTIPAAVVVQAHLPLQWRDELKKFLPEARVHIVKKMQPYDLPEADVYIITYRKLSAWVNHLAARVRCVVFDEAQELRRKESDQYEAAKLLADAMVFRFGLTATPVYNYGSEIWNVFNVLAPNRLGSEHEFLREWCPGAGIHKVVENPDALGHYLRSSFMMIRRTRKDVGRELPPITRFIQEVGFNENVYNAGVSSAEILARTLLTSTEFVERGQASRAFEMKVRQATGLAKAPFVCDFVRMLVESGEKVLLGAWHHAVYDIIRDKLRDLNPVFYTGEESPQQKEASKRQFVEGDSMVMVMNIRSGTGLDGLQQACSTVVLAELDWSPAVTDQFVARIARDGQDSPVNVFILVAPVGSDLNMAEVNGVKRAQHAGIVDLGGASETGIVETDPDRIKKLAREFLKARGCSLPVEPDASSTEGETICDAGQQPLTAGPTPQAIFTLVS